MDLTEAMELFKEIKKRADNHGKDLSECRTRILLIDPVLRLLGWDVENPDLVELEYQPNEHDRKTADYVLKNKKKPVAIVEAKNIDKDIKHRKPRNQADIYARDAGALFFVLTNGVTWLLYKRDPTTSFESLDPIVSFDVIHDPPYRCALAAISMWRPNLASDGGPSEAKEPIFRSPETAPDRSGSQAAKQQEQQRSNDSSKDSNNWCTFKSGMYPRKTQPTRLKIDNHVDKQVVYWVDVIHEIVVWLINTGKLEDNRCPILIAQKTFIGHEEVNPDGTPFKIPKKLPSGLILQRNIPTGPQWSKLRQLLGDLEVDRSAIQVFYGPTGQAIH